MDNAFQVPTCRLLSAPRAATSSTASYITTPGPVLHDISHVHCDGEIYDNDSMFEINYNRDLTSSMNHNYASELPAHYLKHWGLLVDTGAYVSVAPKHFAPEVVPYHSRKYHIQSNYSLLRQPPSRSMARRLYYWSLAGFLSMFGSTSQT